MVGNVAPPSRDSSMRTRSSAPRLSRQTMVRDVLIGQTSPARFGRRTSTNGGSMVNGYEETLRTDASVADSTSRTARSVRAGSTGSVSVVAPDDAVTCEASVSGNVEPPSVLSLTVIRSLPLRFVVQVIRCWVP